MRQFLIAFIQHVIYFAIIHDNYLTKSDATHFAVAIYKSILKHFRMGNMCDNHYEYVIHAGNSYALKLHRPLLWPDPINIQFS